MSQIKSGLLSQDSCLPITSYPLLGDDLRNKNDEGHFYYRLAMPVAKDYSRNYE
jgi:hypothetical protein